MEAEFIQALSYSSTEQTFLTAEVLLLSVMIRNMCLLSILFSFNISANSRSKTESSSNN